MLNLCLGEDAVAVGVDEVARPEKVALGARPEAVAVLLAGGAVGAVGAVVSPLALARVALALPVAGANLECPRNATISYEVWSFPEYAIAIYVVQGGPNR